MTEKVTYIISIMVDYDEPEILFITGNGVEAEHKRKAIFDAREDVYNTHDISDSDDIEIRVLAILEGTPKVLVKE